MKTRITLVDLSGNPVQWFLLDGVWLPGMIGTACMEGFYLPNPASLTYAADCVTVTYHEATSVMTTDRLRDMARAGGRGKPPAVL